MQFRLIALLVGMLLAVAGQAQAQNAGYGPGMKDRVMIPAPIPDHGAIAVPAGVPVPEGFTYYLRADLGWGFAGDRGYSEGGRVYGQEAAPFAAATTFTSGAFASDLKSDDVFLGTVGFGAYFTPRLRGDLTIDFRSKQDLDSTSSYSYVSSGTTNTVDGTVQDRFRVNSAVILANLYLDLLPRGAVTPYIGAGIGFVYNDVTRTYTNTEVEQDGNPLPLPTNTVTGSSKEKNVALAAALMAGSTFSFDQHWMLDVNYRALYLGGIDVVTPTNSVLGDVSKATIDGGWEHQVRIGLRYNIW